MEPRERSRTVRWSALIAIILVAGVAVSSPICAPTPLAIAGVVDVEAATVDAAPRTPGAPTWLTITFPITRELEVDDTITFEVSDTLGMPAPSTPMKFPSGAGARQPAPGVPARWPCSPLHRAPWQSAPTGARDATELPLEIPDMSVSDSAGRPGRSVRRRGHRYVQTGRRDHQSHRGRGRMSGSSTLTSRLTRRLSPRKTFTMFPSRSNSADFMDIVDRRLLRRAGVSRGKPQ